jgi:hypothetical protein
MSHLKSTRPLGLHDFVTAARLPSGRDKRRGPIGVHPHIPRRVADAGTPKKTPLPVTVNAIVLHVYMDINSDKGYPPQSLFEWIRGKRDDPDEGLTREWVPDHWSNYNVQVELLTNTKTGVKDFKGSLQRKGAIVVYLGHSLLDQYHGHQSLGLVPNLKDPKDLISSKDLRTLLKKSQASMVIIASCDSITSVGTLGAGPIVIATDSGPDKTTWSPDWAIALGAFLFLLIGLKLDEKNQPTPRKGGPGTINEALDASAAAFDGNGTKDRFKLMHGDGSTKVFP